MFISQAQLQANRANALLSSGPVSAEGKARSSLNALVHGIFSKHVLLPGEDAKEYAALRESVLRRMNPQDRMELNLAQQYVTAAWRLQRLHRAECEAYLDQAQADRIALLEAHVRMETQAAATATHAPTAQAAQAPAAMAAQPWQPPVPDAGWLMWRLMEDGRPATLERFARYEQRLQGTMRRCLRDLQQLRQQLPADQQPSELVKSELSAQALQIEPISAEAQAIHSSDQQLYRELAACQQQAPAPQKPKALPEKRTVREKSIYVEIDELLREHAQRRRQQKAAAEAARAAS